MNMCTYMTAKFPVNDQQLLEISTRANTKCAIHKIVSIRRLSLHTPDDFC